MRGRLSANGEVIKLHRQDARVDGRRQETDIGVVVMETMMTDNETKALLTKVLDKLEAQDAKLSAMREEHSAAMARLDGQMSIIVQWLQSMDQRFTAIMTPHVPPHVPPERKAG